LRLEVPAVFLETAIEGFRPMYTMHAHNFL
jgi:hypothetical protein